MATVADLPVCLLDSLAPRQHFLLRNVDWRTYRTISRALGERHLRFTFDRGSLEFMTISRLHGRLSRLIGRLVSVLSEEFKLPISSEGDVTLDREDLDRGVEPDECFYIQNEPRVREKETIDLGVDPPPDLAIEIDVSRSSLDRLRIYAEIGVPEVWRFDGATLECHRRTPEGKYTLSDTSLAFAGLWPNDLVPFILRFAHSDQNAIVHEFRDWVRVQIACNWPARS